jgi:2-polyprenyl-6-methoxyphenol hydroxylase-like FAD-dependent oxidoreductase/dienelactone hydrolase
MNEPRTSLPVLVAGGGIGGLAAALALTRQGLAVKVLEQAPQLGEIGAGIQLGPNAFAAFDALGIGERARARAVYIDEMVMHDALDETLVGRIPTGEAFRQRFGNPYAVIHRADVHKSLLEGAQAADRIQVLTSTTVLRVDQDAHGVTVHDTKGGVHHGCALIGADGVKSAVRHQVVGDEARVSGHVVYRAVIDRQHFPQDLQWNAASIWVGPNCHLVHYPLRGGEQYNVVVTFHSREQEEWGVREGNSWKALTPQLEAPPAVRSLRREFITFKRDDGVDMSFWLVLPPDWQEGQKRPALVWAYPLEYTDSQLASQQAAQSERTQWPPPGSPAWLALEGYVVVYDATMPIVGDSKTVNDDFLEQMQLNARAIVDKLEDSGAVDVRRLAVGGQSYGAFTAVNLLAHTKLFKAGIARSGAYNRTLTPFGFQSERRNLWEAKDAYLRLSPLLFANQIKDPLLLLHGEQDPNSGTPVLQSERLYHALAGLGQPVRLTVLPLEGHALASREAAGQVQWEMANWLRKHLGSPNGR